MRTRNLLVISCLLILGNLNGQSDFKAGYVVLANNDTIIGEIDSRGDQKMSQTCRFKPVTSDSIIYYSPFDLMEYRFLNGKCYISKFLENGNKVFLEYLINGKLNIYYYRDEKGEDYYLIGKEGFPLKVIPYLEEIRITPDGINVLYKSTLHIGLLQYYTDDASDFLQEPLKIQKPDHNNLIDFAKKYHNRICKDEDCIIYEKDMPLIKASIEIIAGPTSLNKEYFIKSFTSEYGTFIYLWMPRVNERFFLKTGFLLSPIEFDNKKSIYKIIPMQVQYQYSHFKLIPKVFIGVNTYLSKGNDSFWTTAAGVGVDFRLSQNVSLTSSFTAEFIPPYFVVVDEFFFSNSVSSPFFSYTVCLGLRFKI
jgi:hypothetical protein